MAFLQILFVIAHIVTAAAWFGLGLRLAARARLVLTLHGEDARAAAADTARDVRLAGLFILLTLGFALGAFLLGGGFGVYGTPYHTSLLLILIVAAVHYGLVRPGWAAVREAAEAGRGESEEAASGRKRVAMGVGIGHLLWLVLLVLMFWTELSVLV